MTPTGHWQLVIAALSAAPSLPGVAAAGVARQAATIVSKHAEAGQRGAGSPRPKQLPRVLLLHVLLLLRLLLLLHLLLLLRLLLLRLLLLRLLLPVRPLAPDVQLLALDARLWAFDVALGDIEGSGCQCARRLQYRFQNECRYLSGTPSRTRNARASA
jgi:hypothetical protein